MFALVSVLLTYVVSAIEEYDLLWTFSNWDSKLRFFRVGRVEETLMALRATSNVKFEPSFSLEVTDTFPPRCSHICFEIDKPRPIPC